MSVVDPTKFPAPDTPVDDSTSSPASVYSSSVDSQQSQQTPDTVSDTSGDPTESRLADPDDAADAADQLTLPLLGTRSIAAQQRLLTRLFVGALLFLGLVVFYTLSQNNRVNQQVAATGQSLMQSQRLAKSISQALVGSETAFADVKESAQVLATTVRALRDHRLPIERPETAKAHRG